MTESITYLQLGPLVAAVERCAAALERIAAEGEAPPVPLARITPRTAAGAPGTPAVPPLPHAEPPGPGAGLPPPPAATPGGSAPTSAPAAPGSTPETVRSHADGMREVQAEIETRRAEHARLARSLDNELAGAIARLGPDETNPAVADALRERASSLLTNEVLVAECRRIGVPKGKTPTGAWLRRIVFECVEPALDARAKGKIPASSSVDVGEEIML